MIKSVALINFPNIFYFSKKCHEVPSLIGAGNGLIRFAHSLRSLAHRRPAFFRPPFACSRTRFCGFASLYLNCRRAKKCHEVPSLIGAGNGNRTRIKSLGSSHSTIELCLPDFPSNRLVCENQALFLFFCLLLIKKQNKRLVFILFLFYFSL